MTLAQTGTGGPKTTSHPEFDSLIQRLMQTVDKEKLADLRKEFHTRLRITLTHPDSSELIEDLWDFFYDWCVFENNLPEILGELPTPIKQTWDQVRQTNQRGLYTVVKIGDKSIRLKELFTSKSIDVSGSPTVEFLGMAKGDILEGRLVTNDAGTTVFQFVRRPSYHPAEVHAYIKKKVKQFKKEKDFNNYQTWLWLLVGMYLKHRIYTHMPIEKIYDDNSRI